MTFRDHRTKLIVFFPTVLDEVMEVNRSNQNISPLITSYSVSSCSKLCMEAKLSSRKRPLKENVLRYHQHGPTDSGFIFLFDNADVRFDYLLPKNDEKTAAKYSEIIGNAA